MRKLLTIICLALTLATACGHPAFAAPETTRYQVTVDDLRIPREYWYGMYTGDNKMGYAVIATRRGEVDGDSGLVMDMTMHMQLLSMGQQVEMTMRFQYLYDPKPPFPLRRGKFSMEQAGLTQNLTLVREGDGFRAIQEAAGQKAEMKVPPIEYTFADDMTLEMFFRRHPKPGDEIAVTSLALPDLKPHVERVTVREIKETVANGVKMRYYVTQMSMDEEQDFGLMRINDDGEMLSGFFGEQFELRLEPEELAKEIGYSADLFVLGMVKVNRPLGSRRDVKGLVLDVHGPDSLELKTGARQKVEPLPNGGYRVTVGQGVDGLPAKPGDREENLEETVDFPISHPLVRDLANKAVGDAKTDAEKVVRLARFVGDYVQDQIVPGKPTVFDIIETRRGDCTEHALLFTALARAAGIPAREAGGLAYMGDEVQAFGGHAWNEVILDGKWIPVDATLGIDGVNSELLHLGDNMNVLKSLGRMNITVVDVLK